MDCLVRHWKQLTFLTFAGKETCIFLGVIWLNIETKYD